MFILHTIVTLIFLAMYHVYPRPWRIYRASPFRISKFSAAVEDQMRAVNALSLDRCELLVILNPCGVKTHLTSVNHHSYAVVCSVTLLSLKSGHHGFRSENLCRSFPDCNQALYLSYDCEGFLAATHGTTSLISYIMSCYSQS